MDCQHDMHIETRAAELSSGAPIVLQQRCHWKNGSVAFLVTGAIFLGILYLETSSDIFWGNRNVFGFLFVFSFFAIPTIIGVLLIVYQRTITIGDATVECRSTCVLPVADWRLNRSKYRGVILRRSIRPKYDLCLYHPSEYRSVRIYESSRYEDVLERWKEWSERLGLPCLEYDGDEIVELAPGDLDKNLFELLKEDKVSVPTISPKRPKTLSVEKTASSITIWLGRDKLFPPLLLAIAFIVFCLFGCGAYSQITLPPDSSPYQYLIFYCAAAFAFAAGYGVYFLYVQTERVIRADRENLIYTRVTKSGRELFSKVAPIDRIRFIHAAYPNFQDRSLKKQGLTVDTFDGAYDIHLDCGSRDRERIKRVLLEWIAGVGTSAWKRAS